MKRKRRPGAADKYTAARRRHMKWLTAVICMAVLVAFGTVYGLMMPATAMEGETYCGMTEHTHSASCYSSELTCGLAQDGTHVHDSSCYTEVLTCQIPEHTHSESCYVNPNETQPQSGTQTGDTTVSAGTQNGSTTTSSGTQDTASPSGTAAGDNGVISGNGEAGNGSGTGDVTGTGNNGVSGDTGNAGDANSTDVTGNGEDIDETGESETTVDTEETQPESMEAEPVEAAALPSGAQIPEGYTQQYTVRDEVNGFAVTVYAPEGVVPEGAVLTAQMLNVGDAAYTAAEQELDAEVKAALAEDGVSALSADEAAAAGTDTSEAAEPDYGFAALDIHFEDANGNEVEPNGNVYVSIDAAGLLPEDADPETVTVQHHAEQANGDVTVETVADAADATDGVVEVVESNANAGTAGDVQAAFTVSGFSRFTITWGSYGFTYFEVTVHYVDENGQEIQGTHSENVTISNNDTVTFSKYAGAISGYSYSAAHYGSYNGSVVTSMRAWQTGNVSNRTHYLAFYNGSSQVDRLDDDNKWWESETASIYLVYTKDNTGGEEGGGGGTGGSTTNATVTTSKTAVLKDDDSGNYDLTLSISGTRGSETNPAMVDVLFIVDRSASMTNDWSPRLNNAKTAMNTLVNSLENNGNIDARYSIVTFSGPTRQGDSNGKSDASVHMGWTSVNGNNVSNSISRITSSGGTNYQAGLDVGTDQLTTARSGAIKVVIFLSDGEPTWSYKYGDGTQALDRTPGGRGSTYQGWVDTLNQAKEISCDYFYAIGIGSSSTDYLNDLVNNVNATTKQRIEAASDGSNLTNLFKNIASKVTFFAAENVTITDPLSQYADIVLGADGNPQFTITVTHGEAIWTNKGIGDTLTFNNAGGQSIAVTASYNAQTKTITLDFPNDYELEEGYTYSVSTVITPSQKAIDAGMNSDAAEQTPDTGTGTHADKNEQGFWSNDNDNAEVTFTANDQSGSELFPKPVIQVKEPTTGNLTITKEISGATVTDKSYSFTISTSVEDVAEETYNTNIDGTTVTFSDGDGTYTATVAVNASNIENDVDGSLTISNLPIGEYTVAENSDTALIDGYRFDRVTYKVNSTDAQNVSIKENETTTINVINEYTRLADITLHKVDENGNPLQGAQFQLINSDNQYYIYDDASHTVSWSKNESVLTADSADGSYFHIYSLPEGTYTLIETVAPDGYQLLSQNITITVGQDKTIVNPPQIYNEESNTITITNTTGAILPETGGVGTTYMTIGGLLLIAAAVGGGYGLKRRQRRGRI